MIVGKESSLIVLALTDLRLAMQTGDLILRKTCIEHRIAASKGRFLMFLFSVFHLIVDNTLLHFTGYIIFPFVSALIKLQLLKISRKYLLQSKP